MFSEFFRFFFRNSEIFIFFLHVRKKSDFFRFFPDFVLLFFFVSWFFAFCFLVHDGLLKGFFAHFIMCFGPVVPLANNVNNYGKMQVPLEM